MPASVHALISCVQYMIVIHIRSFCEIERHFVNFCMKSETDDECEASLFFWDKSNTSVCESHEMNLGAEAAQIRKNIENSLIFIMKFGLFVFFSCFVVFITGIFRKKKIFFLVRRHSFFHSMVLRLCVMMHLKSNFIFNL